MKTALIVLGLVALAASVGMFVVGGNSANLSELQELFWVPIPLGLLLLAAGAAQKDS